MGNLRLIVGLGNPGSRYERTRHNAGFLVLDRIRAAGGGQWVRSGEGLREREEAVCRLGSVELLLARPLAFMNRSGLPVSELLLTHNITPAEMLVVVDDVALPPGRLRLRSSGGAGGHNGLRSLQEALGTGDYARLRVGIGTPPPDVDLADFVLEPLADEAWAGLDAIVSAAVEAATVACETGLSAAMDRFNGDPLSGGEPAQPAGGPLDPPSGPREVRPEE